MPYKPLKKSRPTNKLLLAQHVVGVSSIDELIEQIVPLDGMIFGLTTRLNHLTYMYLYSYIVSLYRQSEEIWAYMELVVRQFNMPPVLPNPPSPIGQNHRKKDIFRKHLE